jgi:hypothetical protein
MDTHVSWPGGQTGQRQGPSGKRDGWSRSTMVAHDIVFPRRRQISLRMKDINQYAHAFNDNNGSGIVVQAQERQEARLIRYK